MSILHSEMQRRVSPAPACMSDVLAQVGTSPSRGYQDHAPRNALDDPLATASLATLQQSLSTACDDHAAVALGEHLFDECVRRGWVTVHRDNGIVYGHFTPRIGPSPQAVLRIPGLGWDLETDVSADD